MRRALACALVLAAAAATGCRGGRTSSRAPSCNDAAGRIAQGLVKIRPDLATAGLDVASPIAQACADDAWEPEAIRCYAGTDDPSALRACSDRLASEQRLHAREVQEQLFRRASEVSDGTSDGPTGIQACDDYVALVERLRRCDKIPAHVKDAIGESVDQMRPGWETIDTDDDAAREAAEMGCTAGVDALRQSMDAMGC